MVEGSAVPVSLFVGPVTTSKRDRDDLERRFQNPGSNRPIEHVAGRVSLLIGLWDQDDILQVARPLLVMADANVRTGLKTRYSVFATLGSLQAASKSGWSSQPNASGEIIRCIFPPLLPIAVEAARSYVRDDDDTALQGVILGSGLADDAEDDGPAAERARRAAQVIVRDRAFSTRVRSAYRDRCAMCGLGLAMSQGAHIYPASAPGSEDQPWNGLALCPNHHVAFDRYLVAVDPETLEIKLHAAVHAAAETDEAARALIATTYPALARPTDVRVIPRPSAFRDRYAFYGEKYDWL